MSAPSSKHTPQPVSSKTTYALAGVALAVVVLVIFALYQWNSGGTVAVRDDGYGPVHNPDVTVAMDSDGAIVLGKSGVKTIDVYEDPLCPACGQLEKTYGQEIAKQVDEGKLAVRYRLVNFLDSRSRSKDYSTRAVAASECVAQAGDGPAYGKFHTLLFTTKQPEEGGPDHSNQDLATIAKDAGATDDTLKCITTADRLDSARNHAEAAMKALTAASGGGAATPSVFINDKKIDVTKNDWVLNATK
ncbi:MAG: serine/threonine protein kinase [Nocardia sp.]|uniref:DsbA family protein n=1 Tax=Nocardia sp. TaxID=1821 RepID=UPI0026226079|nr:thioredoxin domain-containing protein [Nocardia sp.]MCU1642499.1 serine/threonine protein kinase [Nocardia sp.]